MRPRFSGQWCSHTRKPSGTDGVQSDGQGDEETEDKQAVPTGAQLKPGGPGRRRSAARTAAGLPGPGGSWPAAGLGSLRAGDGVSDDSSLPRPQLEGSGAPRRLGAAPARLSRHPSPARSEPSSAPRARGQLPLAPQTRAARASVAPPLARAPPPALLVSRWLCPRRAPRAPRSRSSTRGWCPLPPGGGSGGAAEPWCPEGLGTGLQAPSCESPRLLSLTEPAPSLAR